LNILHFLHKAFFCVAASIIYIFCRCAVTVLTYFPLCDERRWQSIEAMMECRLTTNVVFTWMMRVQD